MTTNLRPTVESLMCKISENGKNTQRPYGVHGCPTVDIVSHSETAGQPVPARPTQKLPEGWHNTERFGEVFVSPGGIPWVVQRNGNKLVSVSVPLAKEDIIQKPSAERVKNARRLSVWRNRSRVTVTKPPILTPSVVSKANDGVNEVNRKEG